jgi:hypothetical protein
MNKRSYLADHRSNYEGNSTNKEAEGEPSADSFRTKDEKMYSYEKVLLNSSSLTTY